MDSKKTESINNDYRWACMVAEAMEHIGFENVRSCYPRNGAETRIEDCFALGDLPMGEIYLMDWFWDLQKEGKIKSFDALLHYGASGTVCFFNGMWQGRLLNVKGDCGAMSLRYGGISIVVASIINKGYAEWASRLYKEMIRI